MSAVGVKFFVEVLVAKKLLPNCSSEGLKCQVRLTKACLWSSSVHFSKLLFCRQKLCTCDQAQQIQIWYISDRQFLVLITVATVCCWSPLVGRIVFAIRRLKFDLNGYGCYNSVSSGLTIGSMSTGYNRRRTGYSYWRAVSLR